MFKLRGYKLKVGNAEITLAMPRRAHVIAVTGGVDGVMLHTRCLHDTNTNAFDVENSRQFVTLQDGDIVPDGAVHMGSARPGPKADTIHVFELPRVKPHGL